MIKIMILLIVALLAALSGGGPSNGGYTRANPCMGQKAMPEFYQLFKT